MFAQNFGGFAHRGHADDVVSEISAESVDDGDAEMPLSRLALAQRLKLIRERRGFFMEQDGISPVARGDPPYPRGKGLPRQQSLLSGGAQFPHLLLRFAGRLVARFGGTGKPFVEKAAFASGHDDQLVHGNFVVRFPLVSAEEAGRVQRGGFQKIQCYHRGNSRC